KDITPSHLNLIDRLQEYLVDRGFDEVRSWVLVDHKENSEANYLDWEEIKVTNSINEEVPFLRQSIAVSLIGQQKTYQKNNIPDIKLFEIGKIFGKGGSVLGSEDLVGGFKEVNALGILQAGENIDSLRIESEALLRSIGVQDILFKAAQTTPQTAHKLT